MVNLRLYELSDRYNHVLDMLEATDDKEALQDTLDSLEDVFEMKVESIVKLWRQKCAERDFIKQERVRLEALEKRMDKDAEWLKQYVEYEMKRTGISKVQSSLFKIALANNPVAVDVVDEDNIPERFKEQVVTFKIDKKAIKEAIEAGEEITGAVLRQDQSLRVR